MDADGVPQDVRMPQVARQTCRCGVSLEEIADRLFGQRMPAAPPSAKEVRTVVTRTDGEVSTEELFRAAMQWVPMTLSALEPRDPDLITLNVIKLDERDFAAPEPVPVGEIEQEKIADVLLRDEREEAFHLKNAEVLNRALLSRSVPAW